MLQLNDVTIEIQSFGTVWAIFLSGKEADVELRFNSFWNHKAVSTEMIPWTNSLWQFWTTPKAFTNALVEGALAEILNTENTKGTNPMGRAREIAAKRLAEIDRVTVIKKDADPEPWSFGTSIAAEKTTGNFNDCVSETITTFRD